MAEEQQESYIGSMLSNPEKRRKFIIIAAIIVILIVVLAVVLVLVLVLPKLKPKCKLTDQPRKVDLNDVGRFPSQNNQALVRLSAYIYLMMDEERKYLDLDLKRAKYLVPFEGGEKHLVLDTDCAQLDFNIYRDTYKNVCTLEYIIIESKTPNAKFSRCRVDVGDVNFDCNHHWFCPKERYYYFCYDIPETGGTLNATHVKKPSNFRIALYFNLLEFEVDGDPHEIAKGHFSTKAIEC